MDWEHGLVVVRYIGATSSSSTPSLLIRSIMQEIQSKYPTIDRAIPENDSQKLLAEFEDWLELAAQEGPLLLVLDGINQFSELERAKEMSWLPTCLPTNVRVILSTLTDCPSCAVMAKRNATIIPFLELEQAECRTLIVDFLGRYGKLLDATQTEMVIDCERTRNPLFASTFLNEVRVFGSFEDLTAHMGKYLEATTLEELFGKVKN